MTDNTQNNTENIFNLDKQMYQSNFDYSYMTPYNYARFIIAAYGPDDWFRIYGNKQEEKNEQNFCHQ